MDEVRIIEVKRKRLSRVAKGWIIALCILLLLIAGYIWFNNYYIKGTVKLREDVLLQFDFSLIAKNYMAFETDERYVVNVDEGCISIYIANMDGEKMKTVPLINMNLFGDNNMLANRILSFNDSNLHCRAFWVRPFWYWHSYPLEGDGGMYDSGIPNFTIDVVLADSHSYLKMIIDTQNLQDGIKAIEAELIQIMQIACGQAA